MTTSPDRAARSSGDPAAARASFTTLVAPGTLDAHLDDPSWLVVDCRFDLAAPTAGEQAYLDRHVPGAVYAHLDRDLSGPANGANGRHPLPDLSAMAATMGGLGVDAGVQVVVYDQDLGMYASRLWWMLRYLGHDAVALLDGGLARWLADGRATRAGREARPPRTFEPRPRPDMLVTVGEVTALLGDGRWRLIDARAPERYRGESEPLDRVAGHIPGAANVPYRDNSREDATLRSAEDLRARYRSVLGEVPPAHAIAYCGSGVSACHTLLALEVAGLGGARLYAGSWSEWSADPSRPTARGRE